MFRNLEGFLKSKAPSRPQAATGLRTLFVLAFGGQLSVVVLVWGVLLLLTSPAGASPLTAWVLVAASGLLLPAALYLSMRCAKPGGKEGAMAAAIALGALLPTPAWFALFAWLTGSEVRPLLIFLGILGLYYALGILLAGRYANVAAGSAAK